jgi:hypothetical protein
MTESDIQVIRQSISYDATTGSFARRTSSGIVAIPVSRYLVLGGKKHATAKVAWLLGTGAAPCGVVSHLNGVITDYRLANLLDGVRHKAQVRIGKTIKYLGYFPTKESRDAAIAQYRALHAAGLV